MKFELKIILLGLLISLIYSLCFHFLFLSHQKNIYVCQVGIYAVAENKDAKVSELNQLGYEAYSYVKDNQYYVLSMISDDLSEIEDQAQEVNGIVKTYYVDNDTSYDDLLEQLQEGDISD